MFDDSILKPIKEALFEAYPRNVLAIHVTHDFYMKVKAWCTPPIINFQIEFGYPILGYKAIEHFELCEKDWWLEFEGDNNGNHE